MIAEQFSNKVAEMLETKFALTDAMLEDLAVIQLLEGDAGVTRMLRRYYTNAAAAITPSEIRAKLFREVDGQWELK
jgi:hypothetical protein